MDYNTTNSFTNCDDDFWMDISLIVHMSTQPLIQQDMQDTDMSTTPSYMNCGEVEKIFLAMPPLSPPMFSPAPLKPLLPAPVSHPFGNATATTATTQSPAAININASLKPKTRKRTKSAKEPKTKVPATPTYKKNLEDCKSHEERKRVLHAIKCHNGRIQKAQEKHNLVQNNAHLTNQVQMLTEQLRAARERNAALEHEVERREKVIEALSWDVAIKMCAARESQRQC